MTNAVQLASQINVPAHILELAKKFGGANTGAAGGIRAAGFPRISLAGSKFHLMQDGEKQLITDPTNPQLPKMQLETVVIGWNELLSKTYYEHDYEEGGDAEPDCSSEDGIAPEGHVQKPQSQQCATCPQNAWGSKVSKVSGKPIKACSDNKRLALLPLASLDYKVLGMIVQPGSLKNWAVYVKQIEAIGVPLWMVETRIMFEPTANFPKLVFSLGRFLTPEEIAKVQTRMNTDEVHAITSPRKLIPIQPVAAPAAIPAPAAPAAPVIPQAFAPAAPPVAQAPVAPAAPVIPQAFAPAAPPAAAPVAPAAPTPTPEKPKRAKKADAPAAPTSAVAFPEGTAPHIVAAVTAAGGLASPAGAAVFAALSGGAVAAQPAPAPTPAPSAPAPVQVAPPAFGAAPAAPAVPAAPPQPAGGVAGLAGSLDELLKKAMS